MQAKLFVLSLLCLPSVAFAAPNKSVPETTINATINQFQPVFCKGPKQISNHIVDCYEKTKVTDSKINQCILMDITISRAAIMADHEREKEGKALFSDENPFLGSQAFIKRIDLYMKPQFKESDNISTILTYYQPGITKITNLMVSKCQ